MTALESIQRQWERAALDDDWDLCTRLDNIREVIEALK